MVSAGYRTFGVWTVLSLVTASATFARTRVSRCIDGVLLNDLTGKPVLFVSLIPKKRPKSLFVPFIEFEPNIGFPKMGQTVTRTVLIDGKKASLASQLAVIRFASMNFLRRGWSEDFLAEREQVAREFARRSRYLRLESWTAKDVNPPLNRDLWKDTKLEGSIGLTYSKRASDLLPQEKSLGIPVTRYKDSRGRSIVVELRTYAKNPDAAEIVMKALRSDLVTMTLQEIRDYPELYDKPIIYTYGDETSVRMYGRLGFKIQEHLTPKDKPIEHDGSKWWVLAITPRELERQWLMSLQGERRISNLNQPYPLQLPSGMTAFAAPGTAMWIRENGTPRWFYTDRSTQLAPGLFARKHALVQIDDRGRIAEISGIGKNPYGITPGFHVLFSGKLDRKSGLPKVRRVISPPPEVRR